MSWAELAYGLDRHFISSRGVVDYAIDSLSIDSPEAHYELAGLDGADPNDVKDLLARLSRSERSEGRMRCIWIYLTLLWVYRNQDSYSDVFQVAELLYADFDYPECMASIIRYMPPKQPGRGGKTELLENWRVLLEDCRTRLLPNPGR
ncbi:DUF2247 family protein [Luteibacter jiangsuensis]|uniref:DUF2247 family protein n=1 Tax=Luteibacter jiangsuensis TaxID=637577 RepID=A0ABX0QA83_9GAMM|nr:DUF2247 family protein [Luteibacter jiangsuensis]NID06719.1 DUF2247 family protein [Luteibacter jiangsuensis]